MHLFIEVNKNFNFSLLKMDAVKLNLVYAFITKYAVQKLLQNVQKLDL